MKQLKDFRIIEIAYVSGRRTFFIEETEIQSYLFGIIKITSWSRIQNTGGYDSKETALKDINSYIYYYNNALQSEYKIHKLP